MYHLYTHYNREYSQAISYAPSYIQAGGPGQASALKVVSGHLPAAINSSNYAKVDFHLMFWHRANLRKDPKPEAIDGQ